MENGKNRYLLLFFEPLNVKKILIMQVRRDLLGYKKRFIEH